MREIDDFIAKVDEEIAITYKTGVLPAGEEDREILERLCIKFPELGLDPNKEMIIRQHARIALNAQNN